MMIRSAFHLRDQLRPTIEYRPDRLFFGRRQAHRHAADTEIAIAPQYAQILWRAAQGHRQRSWVAAGFLGHFAEARHELFRATRAGARRRGQDPVAVADRAPRGEAERAAHDHRRMRLLHGFRPSLHRWKIDDLAVILSGLIGPYLFHRLDLLAHLQGAGLEDGSVVFHLLGIPAATDAEEDAAFRYLVERRDELRRLDCISLGDQADSRAEPELCGDGARGREPDERIRHGAILLCQRRLAGRGGGPAR